MEYRLKDDEQLCFIHLPKNAGTTLISIIDSKFELEEICPTQVWRDLTRIPREELSKYKLLRGHFFYGICELLPKKPVYITMLRSPIDRVVSIYDFWRNTPKEWLNKAITDYHIAEEVDHDYANEIKKDIITYEKATSLELKDFLLWGSEIEVGVSNGQTRTIALSSLDQLAQFSERELLKLAKEHLDEFVFLGLVERFQDSMSLLSYTFGWTPIVEYQKLMVTSNRLCREALPQETIDIILEMNQLDVELYQYAQQLFESRFSHMKQELIEGYDKQRYAESTTLDFYRDLTPIQPLLEKHYERRYAELPTPLLQSVDLKFNQVISGWGWHFREGSPEAGTAFRWTGPGTVSTLDLPLATDKDLVIKFRIIGAVTSDILESLTLKVNDDIIELITLYQKETVTIFQGFIPYFKLISDKSFTRLTFQVTRTISPHSIAPSNLDVRPVGLAFNWLQIFPATQHEDSNMYMLFPGTDSYWVDTASFLQKHVKNEEKLIAPIEFQEKFPGRIYPDFSPVRGEVDYQWAVIYKGIIRSLDLSLLKRITQSLVPVFANEIFVVFSNHSNLSKLPPDSLHMPFFWATLKEILL